MKSIFKQRYRTSQKHELDKETRGFAIMKAHNAILQFNVAILALGLVFGSATTGHAHSGGLNASGCHAGSKPYHCHRASSVKSSNKKNRKNTTSGKRVTVRDVDTIVVNGVPVRLNGSDGPELGTRAGQDAKRWMVNALRGKTVNCELTGAKTYDRYVGTCFIDGVDLTAASIAAGHALDCRRYSNGMYAHLETPAAKSGIRRSRYCR